MALNALKHEKKNARGVGVMSGVLYTEILGASKAYLSPSIREPGQHSAAALTGPHLAASANHHCHLLTHTFTNTRTRAHWDHMIIQCCLSICTKPPTNQPTKHTPSQPTDQCEAASHRGPDVGTGHYCVSATLSARAVSKSKGSAAREKGANISSITPERHRAGMQIASRETPGGVKEELAGRRREANE